MSIKELSQIFSTRDLRNAILGLGVVFGGGALAALTYYAHDSGNARFAAIAAGISLVFVLLILIFVVPPLARNASKEASQLNLPFELTLGGAILIGLMMIVGFSAWNTGNNLLFLVFAVLASSLIVGFVAGGFTLKKLDVKMRFPETIFAGEETSILVSIHNRKRLFASYSVVAEVRGKEREESIVAEDIRRLLPRFIANRLVKAPVVRRTLDHFAYLPRNRVTESKVPHVFPNRGRFLIKDFELSTRFPFSFFRHRRRLSARETELLVLPQVEPLSSEIDDIPLEAGELISQKRGSGQDLLSLRNYQAQDDLRRVDWKATARAGQLTVREFAAEDDRRVTVVLDRHFPAEHRGSLTLREVIELEEKGDLPRSESFEKAVTLAASLLSHFSEQQAEVRLILDDETADFGVGSRHLIECLKRLATADAERSSEAAPSETASILASLLESDENSHYFVISDIKPAELPPEMAQKLQFLKV